MCRKLIIHQVLSYLFKFIVKPSGSNFLVIKFCVSFASPCVQWPGVVRLITWKGQSWIPERQNRLEGWKREIRMLKSQKVGSSGLLIIWHLLRQHVYCLIITVSFELYCTSWLMLWGIELNQYTTRGVPLMRRPHSSAPTSDSHAQFDSRLDCFTFSMSIQL